MNSTILRSRRALIAAGILLALILSACGAPFDSTLESQTLAALGDRVWVDTNMDGIQDDGEVSLDGVTVNLYECADLVTPIATRTTGDYVTGSENANGYRFTSLPTTADGPGCYVVEFILPEGYVFSPQDQGPDDAIDSDADPTTGRTAQIVLTTPGGSGKLIYDAGVYLDVPPPPPGNQGCTPGYWQNLRQHADDWVGYSPDQLVSSVFDVGAFLELGAKTLHDAVDARGRMTADQQLVRHAIAGLLNYNNPDVEYALEGGPAQLISDVNAALASGDRGAMLELKDMLDAANNSGCPL